MNAIEKSAKLRRNQPHKAIGNTLQAIADQAPLYTRVQWCGGSRAKT